MTEQRNSIPWYWWAVGALTFLVAYPLSVGPVNWAIYEYGMADSVLFDVASWIYGPLTWIIMYNVWPLSDWLKWYSSFWDLPY